MNHEDDNVLLFGSGDELPSNHSNNPHIDTLINGLSRRQVLAGGTGLGVLAFLGSALPALAQAA